VPDCQVQDMQAGTALQEIIVGTGVLDYSMSRADMQLDSIIVVPEPSGISLLLIGGSLWVLCCRRGANQDSRADADGPPQCPTRMRWTARAYIWRSAVESSTQEYFYA
jgi:hypothetical protein